MGIGPAQIDRVSKSLQASIAKYYGDRVPNLNDFKRKRRGSFIEKLKETVNFADMQLKIAEINTRLGHKNSQMTQLRNNRDTSLNNMRMVHQQQIDELKAKQQKEMTEHGLNYAPRIDEVAAEIKVIEDEREAEMRKFYFKIIGEEDDGRYLRSPDLNDAVNKVVDRYTEYNLMSDEDGADVMKRMSQEDLTSDLPYFSNNMNELRGNLLGFISAGKIPPITIEAWGIVDGKDILSN